MGIAPDWAQLLDDLEKGFELLKRLPPAVTFFGGARIAPDDPMYAASREIGRRFARAGIPPRTGAGPGIMTSVPEGYRAGLRELDPAAPRAHTGAFARGIVEAYVAQSAGGGHAPAISAAATQGIKIYLPFEPEINEAIDESVELMTFPIRRLLLYENSLGLVVFPGGFGTLDELFEVWARRALGWHRDPIVLVGEAFFGPIMRALRQALCDGPRKLVTPEVMDAILVTDDPDKVLRGIVDAEHLQGFDEDPAVIAKRLALEIPYVAGALAMSPQAVTVFGGSSLPDEDPALAAATVILGALARSATPVRIGTAGALAERAVDAYRAVGRADQLQGFFLAPAAGKLGEDLPAGWAGRDRMSVTDPVAHKLLLTQRTQAFLALPGDLRTLDEVFSVLCELQTGKMDHRPLVLLGSDYWRPIIDACAQVMLTDERKTIAPDDLHLVRIVDTPEEALAALSGF